MSAVNQSSNSTTPVTIISSADYAGYVFVPLFLVVGIIGNSLTVRVMLTKSFRSMPVSKLLIALSLSDTCVNLLFPFNKPFVKALLGTDIRALSSGGCKLFFWAYRYFKITSSWMVVFISCERFVAVWFPIKAREINTRRTAYVVIATVYAFFAIYIGYWCSWADQLLGGKCIPNTRPEGKVLQSKVFLIIGLAMYSYIPAAILLVLNIMIVCKLMYIQRKKHLIIPVKSADKSHPDTAKKSLQDRTSKTTVMLLCVAVLFVILVTPNAASHLVSYARNQNIFETTDPGMVFFREFSQVMEQLNNSINIFVYVVFNKRFRDRLMELLRLNRSSGSTVDASIAGTNASVVTKY